MFQKPSGRVTRYEGDGGGVVDPAADEDKSGAFGNAQCVSAAHLDVGGRACPAVNVGMNMNHEAASRRLIAQLRYNLLLLLLDDLQIRRLLATCARRHAGGRCAQFDLPNQLLAAL